MNIKHLFGNRVLLELVDEEYDGILTPAPTREKMHMLSKVIAAGDKAKWVKPGDIVLWQWNKMIEVWNKYHVNGKPVFVMFEGDLIARMSSRKINLGTFEVLGDWCLIRRQVEGKVGRIHLPNTVQDSAEQPYSRHFLVQKGQDTGDRPMELGDELIANRARANPLRLGEDDYFYIQKQFIEGVVGA